MKITVLGCGALGKLWLSALARRGHQVQGWLRLPQPDCSVHLITPQGLTYQRQLPANDPELLAHSDLLLVTLKAWQIANALPPLLPRLSPHCTLLLLHNGMGALGELRAPPRQPLLQGSTTHAARRDGHTVWHVAGGITHIGPLNEAGQSCSALADTLHRALPDVAWHDNIQPALWNKLAINCVINPLSVLYGCHNGALAHHQDHIHALIAEIAEVMEAEGYRTTQETLHSYVMQVINLTADNHSSMLQDVQAQRHTEIDYITGYLIRCGRSHGLALPENRQLFDLIKRKEQTYERIGLGVSGTWQ
ncbi:MULTISPECIES: 2-dehydropantoate 2-reductase [Edwardsiella]|uniref:2-dehydropantoate 2-reductase n=3 Tax=Edwardsiella anguillarum TaxID=1821960 RepID=A0A076LS35_9GAMM|nr:MULTISPECIES: 2-dehydropantoate 2-reductase [Edwardsiella]AKM48474.1 2-dehydropantoate 2-reductase [Edwardsiella sp. EA181011]GAJ67718.1 2-dehydropantoate 2-reductase [Edwardsiella piscicida]AIJ09358.1 2-dehydropantoate 2-reductase [Edwardsiella anguillarum ET080813]KAB0590405.1 2-dehydropantoate 2-reductase [Edwardsiella anguillarum]RFS99603.1 2-dehydropantoate 2-reductase [Edwardsiella anguillarum]